MTIITPEQTFENWNYATMHHYQLRNEEVVQRRLKILEFWKKHGLKAALDFAASIEPRKRLSRATIYRWRKALMDSSRKDHVGRYKLSALDPKSTRPHHCLLPRNYNDIYEPIRSILTHHTNLGKYKVHQILQRMIREGTLTLRTLSALPSVSTIGRIIRKMRQLGRLPDRQELSFHARSGKLYVVAKKKRKKLRRDGYVPRKPGDLVQMDGVIVYCYGKKRYILNAIDYVSEKAISVALPNRKAKTIAKAIEDIDTRFGFEVKHIQTDNGSEFMAEFEQKMDSLGKTHFYNYVKRPQWNGKVERFNRTLQEEWLDDPDMLLLLADDLAGTNEALQKYVDWYNNERPHQAISYMTPYEYVLYYAKGDQQKSQMS